MEPKETRLTVLSIAVVLILLQASEFSRSLLKQIDPGWPASKAQPALPPHSPPPQGRQVGSEHTQNPMHVSFFYQPEYTLGHANP